MISVQFTHHLDIQVSILVDITSAIFIFTITKFFEGSHDLALVILSSFSAVSTLIALVAVHPPKVVRKTGQEESLMFNKTIFERCLTSNVAKVLEG